MIIRGGRELTWEILDFRYTLKIGNGIFFTDISIQYKYVKGIYFYFLLSS